MEENKNSAIQKVEDIANGVYKHNPNAEQTEEQRASIREQQARQRAQAKAQRQKEKLARARELQKLREDKANLKQQKRQALQEKQQMLKSKTQEERKNLKRLEKQARQEAKELARKENADLIFATDPDCDRIGVVVKTGSGEYVTLNGNQMGVLLTEFIFRNKKEDFCKK